jgi:hypothetical protein
MQMYTLRISLVPEDPSLFESKSRIKGMESVIKSLGNITKINKLQGQKDSNARYSLKVIVDHDKHGVMGGMVSKAHKLHGHDSEFNAFDIDDFPPLIWFFDVAEQVLLVEKNSNVFSSAHLASKCFQSITNCTELAEAGLRAEIEPVLEEGENDFWSEYDNFEFVQRVEFDLIPPNLFGETERSMKEALGEVSNQTNANRVKTILENTSGMLKLQSEGWIGNTIRWITKGGGSWKMWGKNGARDNLKNVSSNKSAKLTLVEGELTEAEFNGYDGYELEHLLSHVRANYTYKDKDNA